jgi:alkylation response protein AidB-like acyl-CoA dehydrogenase
VTVDYRFSDEDVALRARLRGLIAENMSPDYPGVFVEDPEPLKESFRFAELLGQEGLLTRAWPVEYGGEGVPLWSQVVFNEEMWAHNEPRGGQYMGVTWIGPALMTYGTPDQRERHLPKIASGTVQWCQGFSEPDAGSDLASLRTAAVKTDNGFRINGQKIWTSYSSYADYCVLAARTDSSGPKQQGITVFLVPMDRSGITVRPIDNMLGPNHFSEVFFEDVEVLDSEVLGEVGKGWEVMNAGLAFERVGVPRYARSDQILAQIRDNLSDEERVEEAPRIATAMTHTLVARLLGYRVIADREREVDDGPAGSITRVVSTTLDQEVADLAMELLGARALVTHEEAAEAEAYSLGHMEHHWRYAQASTVAAGTLEIQKMLISRKLL